MPLLPFDLITTVGTSAAVFLLGLIVWWRNKWAAGTVLYTLMAMSLAMWTSADWFLNLQATALPLQILFWKLLFYLGACLGSAYVVHVAAHLAGRTRQEAIGTMYLLSALSFACIAIGFSLRIVSSPFLTAQSWLTAGAVLAVLLYVFAVFYVAIELFPIVYLTSARLIDRRRAAYGLVILIPYILAGALQFIVGPLPTGFFMPFLTGWFLLFSMIAFIRASYLNVDFRPLEAFFLFLSTYAIIILLRSRDKPEAIVALIGSVAVGVFGVFAIRAVREGQAKCLSLEAANRELKLVEEAKSDFVEMVSHQLRGPLGGIRGASSMLVDGDYGALPERAREAARLIQDSVTRMLSLADTFLDVSKLDVGVYESRRVPTSVRREVTSIVEEMSNLAASKGLALSAEIASDIPETLSLDKEVLRQATFNLLDNAIKYTDHGSVIVAARHDAGELVLEIRDTGMGLSAEERHQLFRKFHRGKAGHDHTVDGTGLGLYIVKRLVEAASGMISVASGGPGNGSAFIVRLPAERVDETAAREVR